MALSQTSVLKLYHTVIDDVIAGVRDSFLDEGVDEQVLQEMKQVWTNKLMASKAVEAHIEPTETQPPPIVTNNTPKSKPNGTKSKKPSAQREHKNTESNAAQNTVAEASTENKIKPNQTLVVTQQHTINKSANSQPIQTQSTAVHQKQPPALVPTQSIAQQQTAPPPPAAIIGLDPSKIVPIQITLPALPNSPNPEPRVLEIQVPASALQENKLHSALTATNIIQSIMTLPPAVAASVLQQHINAVLANSGTTIAKQLDGTADTSDDEGSDVSDDNLDNDDDDDNLQENEEEEEGIGAEEEPLCSDDDVSEEENQNDLFDTENVVVCQYDKITRSRNKWKFYLKDGIMNIGGKDYIFQKSNGDAEW
ncbi:transcription initiation factor IIA subunit 1 [Sitodiplosis mosellana]|uniref:transcription initiation factor IIA subunit 1 n=1 Tax=Sitodiplosis mosellana TaxID=263140 RepID=UPI002443AA63|nr:transcription initiation factor IIA subunit 1 [Sitodiplosis mosellana]